MSNDFVIEDDVYIILLKYFQGDVIYLKIEDIKSLGKGMFNGKQVPTVSKDILKVFVKILKLKEKKPNVYRATNWIYPDWNQTKKKEELMKAFPEEDDDDEDDDEKQVPEENVSQTKVPNVVEKIVIPQRKAFIEWVNTIFYEREKRNHKIKIEGEKDVNIWQYFVKQYLSQETPFRGLLVYHGLGTGKTATAVITSEGLSKTMPIYTFLPASLETNFIREVSEWGDTLFNVELNHWIFIPLEEIRDDITLRKKLNTLYGVDELMIIKLFNKTRTLTKNSLNKNKLQGNIQTIMKDLDKGIFLPSESLQSERRTVYTVSGNLLDTSVPFSGVVKKLKDVQKTFIEEEITALIKYKYNFVHYNPLPKIHEINWKDPEKKEENKTDPQKLVNEFIEKYKYNEKNYAIQSPFKNNVLIIDEVHNLVREIVNESEGAMILYNWIVNSEDVKLVFLSGTPIINRPSEIAILYNMLRGALHIYDFTLETSELSEEDLQKELRDIYYTSMSSIEQLFVSKRKGKYFISFTKNKSNFESILEDDIVKTIKYNDHTLEEFFEEIYDGFKKSSLKITEVIPSQSQLKKVSLDELKLGKPFVFDKDTNTIFNRKQKLFDIYENDTVLDLTDNTNFMNYFFDDSLIMPPKKQVLLRRMLLGLTSYSPINKKSIVNMPQIIEPEESIYYNDYLIANNINIVPCYMSSFQWSKYSHEYSKEKLKTLQKLRRKNMYDNSTFDYHIRTRQNCNIVYEDDTFRNKSEDDQEKYKVYDLMKANGHLSKDQTLSSFSPKFYEIMKRIDKYIDSNDIPNGKVMYYSDFRGDSGSEIFEYILKNHGYEKYDYESEDINKIIETNTKKKRYTFITGEEKQFIRKLNEDAYNHKENINGEYIQIMIISSAGAEGISLKGVRQAHIMEPYWNFIRIDQVFGRAIRMMSHSDLPESKRFVEQYLYLSFLPGGDTLQDVFEFMKQSQWNEVEGISITDDLKNTLLSNHKGVYNLIQKILSIKKETNDRSADQILFDIMEKKHKVSQKISEIIKESSVDCIQNTKDNTDLNQKCLRFSKEISTEESHFPGITSTDVNKVDIKQFQANFTFFIEPNIFVISANSNTNNIFIYYKLDNSGKNIDVRYIRENGSRICDYDPDKNFYIKYEPSNHPMNKILGSKFSLYQSIYSVPEYIYEKKIKQKIFPNPKEIFIDENYESRIIKYNLNEQTFFSPYIKSPIIKLYDYKTYKQNNYSTRMIKCLILRNKKVYLPTNEMVSRGISLLENQSYIQQSYLLK